MHENETTLHEPDDWPILDLSGNKLETLTPYIFVNYHIRGLNLSNNSFKKFPKIILALPNLEVLDISNNQISNIPKEIFFLKNLKVLNLSDNQLTSVPLEIGFLPYLENINLNDNPLIEPFFSTYLNGKSIGILDFCREHNVKYNPPNDREWKKVLRIGECCSGINCLGILNYEPLEKPFSLTIGSMNILSPHYATRTMFPYAPHYVISWDKRKDTIYKQIIEYNFDIFGLQELEKNSFVKHFMPKLQNDNYESLFYTKSRGNSIEKGGAVDGCATFWKKDKFRMVEQKCVKFAETIMLAINNNKNLSLDIPVKDDNSDIIKDIPSSPAINRLIGRDNLCLIVLLETKNINNDEINQIIVANAHLFWNPEYPDVKLYQSCIMIKEIQKMKDKYPNAAIIILGDFNSTPESSVYQLMKEGIIQDDYEFLNYEYGDFSEGIKGLNLKDVYCNTKQNVNCCKGVCCQHNLLNNNNINENNNDNKLNNYLERVKRLKYNNMTTFTPNFCNNIDYIFVSNEFSVTHNLARINEEYFNSVGGFPTTHLPSDHILIAGKIEFDKKKKNFN